MTRPATATFLRAMAATLAVIVLASPVAAREPDGQRILTGEADDDVPAATIERIASEARANIAMLAREGRLPTVVPKVSGIAWPLGPVDGAGTDWHGISNFVDLNSAFPDQVQDYTCSNRTYDTAGGYNHRGIDYFVWPFPWMLLDQGTIEVKAVAAGTLVARADGNNDRSCSMNAPDTPNYVSIRHADNTVAYYLHMKNGSVTTLPIGSAIPVGTVLGRVGSSGVSTGPHLHLELRASTASNAAVIEPHNGTCNAAPSAWAQQRPYRESRINRLSTHGIPPVSPTCGGTTMPGTDTPNFKTQFNPGDTLITLAAFRDQVSGTQATYRILRPDLSVFASWDHTSPATYNASFWYWTNTLPGNAPHGLWTFEATYQGVKEKTHFRVGNTTTAIADMRGLIGAWFEPTTSGQGFELHWINDTTVLLFFYGHHDNGENFFLLGQREAPFDFNQEVRFSMYRTIGGRWNNFDPALITRPTWGTLDITFVDCEHAVAELVGLDGTKLLSLQRLGRTSGLDCDGT